MNLSLAESDVIYLYMKGLTASTDLSFFANYATSVDYRALTSASMQGPGAGMFSCTVLQGNACRLTLSAADGVKYSVGVKDSVFAFTRGAAEADITVAEGTALAVYAHPQEGFLFDCWLEGTDTVERATSFVLTANGDRTLSGKAVAQEKAQKNGILLHFGENAASAGNFWLGNVGKEMIFTETEDGDKRISVTFTNYGAADISAILRIVASDWATDRGKVTVTVPAGGFATAELMNLEIAESDIVYFYLSGLTGSSVGVIANYADPSYASLSASSMQGTGDGTFAVKQDYTSAVKVTLDAAEGAAYTLSVNDSIFAVNRNLSEGTVMVPAGTKVTVAVSAQKDTALCAKMGTPVRKVQNGLTVTFNESLTASDGNFWLDNSGHGSDLLFTDIGAGSRCASLTFVNYGSNDVRVTFRIESSNWGTERGNVSATVAAGTSKTLDISSNSFASGDISYFCLTAGNSMGVIANYADVDFSNVTAANLSGPGSDTFSVSMLDMKLLEIPSFGGSTIVTINGSQLTPYRGITELSQYVAEGTQGHCTGRRTDA